MTKPGAQTHHGNHFGFPSFAYKHTRTHAHTHTRTHTGRWSLPKQLPKPATFNTNRPQFSGSCSSLMLEASLNKTVERSVCVWTDSNYHRSAALCCVTDTSCLFLSHWGELSGDESVLWIQTLHMLDVCCCSYINSARLSGNLCVYSALLSPSGEKEPRGDSEVKSVNVNPRKNRYSGWTGFLYSFITGFQSGPTEPSRQRGGGTARTHSHTHTHWYSTHTNTNWDNGL